MSKRILCAISALALSAPCALAQTPPPPSELFGSWTGLYLGAGVSATKARLSFPGGSGSMHLSDTTAPGVSDFLYRVPMDKSLYSDGTFLNAGLRLQFNRFIFGLDFDHDFGVKKAIAPNTSQVDGVGGVFTTGNFVLLGLNSFGGFESISHFRGVLGYAVSPTVMIFGSAGVAKGRFFETGVSAAGAVASSPSAPLVGQATVFRNVGEKYGTSLGFGMDVKLTDNLVARLEYVYDRYSIPPIGGAGFGGTIGEITVNSFIGTGSSNPRYDLQTIRGSLNYRFGPEDHSAQVAKLTNKDSYGKWGGFYVGGGLTYTDNTTKTNGLNTLTITNNVTSETVVSQRNNPTRTGGDNYTQLLAGYLHQISRFVVGLEYSHNFDSEFNYRQIEFSPGTLSGTNFISNPGAAQCGVYVPGSFTCVGGSFFGAFKATDHLRAIVGYEVLPSLLVFGAGGVMRGVGEFDAVSNSGVVASSPSAPLVGKATISHKTVKTVYGTSFGGGIQYKLLDNLSLRVEYLYDKASMNFVAGGAGFGGTIGDQTTNSFISSGNKETFINESWRASAIYQF